MIPDSHLTLHGIAPVLFSFRGFQLTSYALFMAAGVLAAVVWYVIESRRVSSTNPHGWTIILSALFFGSLGAKLLSAALFAGKYESFGFVQFLYSGRSIIGGLAGGWAGVKLAKWCWGIKTRQGNAIAPAAGLGIAIGRIGCFLGSCCYGAPTRWWIGIDFGDGQPRHPTQLYEAIYAFSLFLYFAHRNRTPQPPGLLFRQFLLAYLAWRFVIEFIRVEPRWFAGLSVFQALSLALIALILPSLLRFHRNPAPEHGCQSGPQG